MAGALDKHQMMNKQAPRLNLAPLFLSAHPHFLAFSIGKLRQVVLCLASTAQPLGAEGNCVEVHSPLHWF